MDISRAVITSVIQLPYYEILVVLNESQVHERVSQKIKRTVILQWFTGYSWGSLS